jgi:Malic enzyme, NAD binding domain
MPNTFTVHVLNRMAKINERPIIFALSTPTSRSECTAMQAYHVTGGRAVFASGNPFDDVLMDGNRFIPGQCNNAYIFPGVGLGIVTSQSRLVPNETFLVAAQTLADQVSESDRAEGRIYPPLSGIRDVSFSDRDRGRSSRLRSRPRGSAETKGFTVVHQSANVRTKVPGLHASLKTTDVQNAFVTQSEVNQEKSPREMQSGL